MNSPDFTAKWNFFRHCFARHWLFFLYPPSPVRDTYCFVTLHFCSVFSFALFRSAFYCPHFLSHFFVSSSSLLRSTSCYTYVIFLNWLPFFPLLSLFPCFIITWPYSLHSTSSPHVHFFFSSSCILSYLLRIIPHFPSSSSHLSSSLAFFIPCPYPSFYPPSSRVLLLTLLSFFYHTTSHPFFFFDILSASLFLTIPLTPTHSPACLSSPPHTRLPPLLTPRLSSLSSHTSTFSVFCGLILLEGGFKDSHLDDFLEMGLIQRFASSHLVKEDQGTELYWWNCRKVNTVLTEFQKKNDTLLVQLQKKSILYWWNCRKMLIL